ncbi:TRAP transporter small permease [uncultured Devosia sp.]|uniref:TRAP transporter small permease n=1 Tax=uncultured Devosia sp. TaxID=211434 RepID=UPI00261DDAC1|nr:TRAP transporter small permease [uncultured Devosia sp.]
MRRSLDSLYQSAGWLSAFCILAISLLISAQVLLNVGVRLSLPIPASIPSYGDFAGYLLAASTFLALAYTFRSGGHIRVSIVTANLPKRIRWIVELLVLAAAAAVIGYALFFLIDLVRSSIRFNDVSSGRVSIPLWIPQTVMCIGVALLEIAVLDTLVQTFRSKQPVIASGEEM